MTVPRALVCAPRLPEFDREGGSRRIFHLVTFLRQAGWAVSFVAENADGGDRYARVLRQMGIATYSGPVTPRAGDDYLARLDDLVSMVDFDLALLAFWHTGEQYIPIIRAHSPRTVIIVDSIDLHFLRTWRGAFVEGKNRASVGVNVVADEMIREITTYAEADAVLTVSDKESDLINDLTARSDLAFTVPDTEDVPLSPVPLEERRGITFIGNFRHPPNTVAVEYFCSEILPLIPDDVLRRHPVSIVGTDPGERVFAAVSDHQHVHVVGWVPSVVPYLHQARISVVPLLHGAGTKRKLIQSLMGGTPVVSTPIGVEGLSVVAGEHVLVGHDPSEFAQATARLLEDDHLWAQLRTAGIQWSNATHGLPATQARFLSVLHEVVGRHLPDGGDDAVLTESHAVSEVS